LLVTTQQGIQNPGVRSQNKRKKVTTQG